MSLAQLVGTMHNIYKVQSSNLDKKKCVTLGKGILIPLCMWSKFFFVSKESIHLLFF